MSEPDTDKYITVSPSVYCGGDPEMFDMFDDGGGYLGSVQAIEQTPTMAVAAAETALDEDGELKALGYKNAVWVPERTTW